MAYQRAYFPMKYLNISQGYGSKSSTHKLSYALDLSGKDNGQDTIYAPFDCKITKLYQPKNTKAHANTVWLTSTEKVLSPNGYYGYLTISITHPSEISKMKLNTIYKQGQKICKEGKTGSATGNHIHLEVAKGKEAGWLNKKNGKYSEYVTINKVKPEKYLFAKENSIIKNNSYKNIKYNFIKESDITYKVFNVTKPPLNIHKTADLKRETIIKNKGLKNNDEVIKFSIKNNLAYIYHYSTLGYVSNKYLKK